MTKPQAKHARTIVETFKSRLSPSGREHVAQVHFEELEMMIESALDSVLVEELENIADRLEAMAGAIRKSADHFDAPDMPQRREG